MGPHSIECGMCLLVQARSLARISLQWGRTLSSAECVVTATDDGHFLVSLLQWGRTLSSAEWRARCESWFAGDPVALMGPHSIECGMWNYSWKIIFRSPASMGPHSIECGMLHLTEPAPGEEILLQWGRTLSSAECLSALVAMQPALSLQWGRTLSSAECLDI